MWHLLLGALAVHTVGSRSQEPFTRGLLARSINVCLFWHLISHSGHSGASGSSAIDCKSHGLSLCKQTVVTVLLLLDVEVPLSAVAIMNLCMVSFFILFKECN